MPQDGVDSAKAAAFDEQAVRRPGWPQKTYACFVRRYDANHLAQHPKQKVNAMKLLVDGGESRRKRKRPTTRSASASSTVIAPAISIPAAIATMSLPQMLASEIRFGCGVDCESGGINVALSKDDKSAIVRLERIRIWNRNKPDDEADDALWLARMTRSFAPTRDGASAELVTDRQELAAFVHQMIRSWPQLNCEEECHASAQHLVGCGFRAWRRLYRLAHRRGHRAPAASRQAEGGLSPERPRQGQFCPRQHPEPSRRRRRPRRMSRSPWWSTAQALQRLPCRTSANPDLSPARPASFPRIRPRARRLRQHHEVAECQPEGSAARLHQSPTKAAWSASPNCSRKAISICGPEPAPHRHKIVQTIARIASFQGEANPSGSK